LKSHNIRICLYILQLFIYIVHKYAISNVYIHTYIHTYIHCVYMYTCTFSCVCAACTQSCIEKAYN